jgi:hypothetical protein
MLKAKAKSTAKVEAVAHGGDIPGEEGRSTNQH